MFELLLMDQCCFFVTQTFATPHCKTKASECLRISFMIYTFACKNNLFYILFRNALICLGRQESEGNTNQGLLGQRDPLRRGPLLRLIGPSGQLPEGHNHLTRGHWGHIQSSRPLPRHRVQTWVLDHAFVVLDRDDLLHQIRWLGLRLGLRLGPGVHEEPVHLLNNPPGKKVVVRAAPPPLRRSSLVVQLLAHVFVYSFGSSPP